MTLPAAQMAPAARDSIAARYENVVFDLDGTLADSFPDIAANLEAVVRERGRPGYALPRDLVGPPLAEMLRRSIPEIGAEEIESISREFRIRYIRSGFPGTLLYPGTEEALRVLREKGCRLFVATNKPQAPTLGILEARGIRPLFEGVESVDTGAPPASGKSEILRRVISRFNLDVLKTVMVGDTPSDIEAAKVNRTASIAVRHGYGSDQELRRAGADHSVGSMAELVGVVGERQGRNE